jgi:hypothetical protein
MVRELGEGPTWSFGTREGGEPWSPSALLLTLDPGVPSSQELVREQGGWEGEPGCECSIPALRALLLAKDDLTASRPVHA